MGRALAAMLLLLAGCGRLQFDPGRGDAGWGSADAEPDAQTCFPVGHDEDADAVDDACDVCPQRPDDQRDTDRDGIGDACDLSPDAQIRTLFDPFTGPRADWTYLGGVVMSDVLFFDSPTVGSGVRLNTPPARETYEVTGRLIDGGTMDRQVSISIGDGTEAYYCELYDNGSIFSLAFTHADGVTYNTIDFEPLVGRFNSGPFRLIFDHTPPTSTCIAEWGGMRVEATGPNPSTVSPDTIGVGVYRVVAEAQSFVRLATP